MAKKLLITKVADGIHKADELLNRAIKGDAPVYHADGVSDDSEESTDEKESLGRKFYKDLMNGVSHMLTICYRWRYINSNSIFTR